MFLLVTITEIRTKANSYSEVVGSIVRKNCRRNDNFPLHETPAQISGGGVGGGKLREALLYQKKSSLSRRKFQM
ncbi:hypothetical protein DLM78_03135 [Leptospira stimsonii]|uniref:Uncharacterized protein n=1 Tax=Leptospira stimsonii TaxID=2202203 RepID=A0A8B3CTG6_9LEPT|nr:hypothetical protein DLM78_03135 [Leptospira stimsonii]